VQGTGLPPPVGNYYRRISCNVFFLQNLQCLDKQFVNIFGEFIFLLLIRLILSESFSKSTRQILISPHWGKKTLGTQNICKGKEKIQQLQSNTRGVSHCGLAIYIKKYIKAKEEFWKLKYFTMQKYNLQKIL
jgi:hypothetical protein